MSSKKFTEKQLLEGLTLNNAHHDLLAKSRMDSDCSPFAGREGVSDDFIANRVDVFDEPSLSLVSPDTFVSELKLALDNLPDGDIELCDLANEIGRVIANLNSPHKALLREVILGVEHGFELINKERGVLNE